MWFVDWVGWMDGWMDGYIYGGGRERDGRDKQGRGGVMAVDLVVV